MPPAGWGPRGAQPPRGPPPGFPGGVSVHFVSPSSLWIMITNVTSCCVVSIVIIFFGWLFVVVVLFVWLCVERVQRIFVDFPKLPKIQSGRLSRNRHISHSVRTSMMMILKSPLTASSNDAYGNIFVRTCVGITLRVIRNRFTSFATVMTWGWSAAIPYFMAFEV